MGSTLLLQRDGAASSVGHTLPAGFDWSAASHSHRPGVGAGELHSGEDNRPRQPRISTELVGPAFKTPRHSVNALR